MKALYSILILLLVCAGIQAAKGAETYAVMASWGSLGTGPGEFDGPYGIAVDPASDVYVADTYNYRIQKFTSTGGFVR